MCELKDILDGTDINTLVAEYYYIQQLQRKGLNITIDVPLSVHFNALNIFVLGYNHQLLFKTSLCNR